MSGELEPSFFRFDLEGNRIPITWATIHSIRRDILHYYEENLNEPQNVYFPEGYADLDYWLYLNIHFEQEWAESARYVWLVERGCLALINGLMLDALGEQMSEGSFFWEKAKGLSSGALPYLRAYQPTEPHLQEGRDYLNRCLEFVQHMTGDDIDEDSYVTPPMFQEQAKWFCSNIVGDYFRTTARLEF